MWCPCQDSDSADLVVQPRIHQKAAKAPKQERMQKYEQILFHNGFQGEVCEHMYV